MRPAYRTLAVLVPWRHQFDGRDQLAVPVDVQGALGVGRERRHGLAVRDEGVAVCDRACRRLSPAANGDIGLAVVGFEGEGRDGTDVGPEAGRETRLHPVEELGQPEEVYPVPVAFVAPVV